MGRGCKRPSRREGGYRIEFLGEVSVFAARAALAAQGQGKHQAFHEAMLASKNELTKEEVFVIAARIGLDGKKLEDDMDSPEWQRALDRNSDLARHLGISGTPGFIVGSELILGPLIFLASRASWHEQENDARDSLALAM